MSRGLVTLRPMLTQSCILHLASCCVVVAAAIVGLAITIDLML